MVRRGLARSGSASTRQREVLAVIGADLGSRRRMIDGLNRYLEQGGGRGAWNLTLEAERQSLTTLESRIRQADGVLAVPSDLDHAKLWPRVERPLVLLGDGVEGVPMVGFDEQAVGRLAFEHFRTLGLVHFAFCGNAGVPFSDARGDGFAAAATRGGFKVHLYDHGIYSSMDQHLHEMEHLAEFFRRIPKPAGLLVSTIVNAHHIVRFCRSMQIAVPDDFAILGVDDDELYSELTRPRLSSIDQNATQVGFEAAALLDRLMDGAPRPGLPIIIQPRAVIPRDSTDMLNVDSAPVAAAIRYIREHVEEGLNVGDVLRRVPISRRALERGFLRNVGRTVHDEILRVRIERAAYLLHHTDLPLPDIAARCGFAFHSKLSEVFKRLMGVTPSAYRRENRTGM